MSAKRRGPGLFASVTAEDARSAGTGSQTAAGTPNDAVNPAHYQGDYVMRIIEDFKLDFLSGTIVKYILRAGNKPGDSALQDFQKAREREIAKYRSVERNPLASVVQRYAGA